MSDQIPEWPRRLSREQAREAKLRSLEFVQSLRTEAMASGWKFTNGSLFRTQGDWFICGLPSLLWERGVVASFRAKPMSVDPLFWHIVGLEENQTLPLSFRANGAFVLRAPARQTYIGLQESDPALLATATLVQADHYAREACSFSMEALIREILSLGDRSRHYAALEVCLRLAISDFEGALDRCNTVEDDTDGGYQTRGKGFFEQARDYIAAHHEGDAT